MHHPPVLILDEATSALDGEHEAAIQAALERMKGQMTLIVIAHRLSTIRHADQIVVLDQGEVIQQGNYHQLVEEERGRSVSYFRIKALSAPPLSQPFL